MTHTWWKESVIYQIYPRSFKDTNGDGIGDLRGIIEKLDYLKELGIDIIWLNPIYKSPNDDNGYDISDYYDIMDEFGTMADFDELLAEAHQRGIRILMDLVVNHTSDEHEWFQQSRQSKDNPYRDYYFWKPEPANNWPSFFSGSVWQKDDVTGEYYLHLFTKKQPDLNWENPAVRQDVYKLMRFWLDKGIDGFRMDVIPMISKRLDFPDADTDDFGQIIERYYANGPRVHEFLQEMYREALADYDVMTVGEGAGIPPEMANDYVGEDRKELSMIFHFGHMGLDHGPGGRFDPKGWTLSEFKRIFNIWHQAVGDRGWVNVFLDNHDFPRMVSRFANDNRYRVESAKLLATLLLTMRGTPCIYYGSEIGMTNIHLDKWEDFDDVEIKNAYQAAKERGDDLDKLMAAANANGRDNARTPMQWDDSPHAGFTTGQPWLKVNPNHTEINVIKDQAAPHSIFRYYQEILQLRKAHSTLVYGDYEDLNPDSEYIYYYRRYDANGEFYIILNFSSSEIHNIPLPKDAEITLLISNYPTERGFINNLKPWEAIVYKVKA
ncbi:MAG TPA: alpha-glucosidase [Saprospiraceae bacterium]|nr:alpha-glucosidase [Saprospiraceae bacterium]HMP24161.1 alpha-glucosidase [Saprospiraceae bacterium]